MSAPALAVEGLTVRYGSLTALDDVSWTVDDGEIVGVIGPNGAGKSSSFAAITNTVPHEGECRLYGESTSGLSTQALARRGLRRTFQQNSFFTGLTVLENAMASLQVERATRLLPSVFTPWREHAARAATRREAAELLTEFGIAARYHELRPDDLPYGLQRVLSIVLAFGGGTRVLLVDEPAAGVGGDDMRNLAALLEELRRRGLAIVLIEHHMDLVMEIVDRLVVIDRGRQIAYGPPGQVQRLPAVLEAYLGRTA
ncbi:MAG TPA: ATP-binding cassette domain-containing protein [Pseudonocardia sp.]|jgi:branched-chain amino acid transport system ATP-binding protein|uniref:ABC transporter ATP-binding protein n=1 Tax=Pseudonocardia sp. TaxID=60912 RepID=UPI002B4B7E97|nr:ATP-binding cassette domain-containing protein [Pseudonocardia sp.]HLU60369.1 ATP-binding cassette domain-containing protein [Pseudonocardia sp.]